MSRRPDPRAGFTLVEVLVALAIAGLALALLTDGTRSGVGNSDVAAGTIEALRRAQSRLALAAAAPLTAREETGEDGQGYRWRLRVAPLPGPAASAAPGAAPPGAATPLALYAIQVEIGWSAAGRTRAVSLRTSRLGPGVAPNG